MKKITVVIVDDHKLIRDSWSFLLSLHPSFEVIGECSSGGEAIEIVKARHPDIVLMDINLPGINGLEATIEVQKISPASKILAVSMHTEPSYARQMIQKGAFGYVTKGSTKEEMFQALEKISGGGKYICQEIKNILAENTLMNNEEPGNGKDLLSKREVEVVQLIKRGRSSKEIAGDMFIATKTVEVHRHNILKKLKLKNTAALVDFIKKRYPDLF
jgi:two-component system invasion response regulator UvrY